MPKTNITITRLEYERRRKGWSKSELARHAGLNASTVGSIENGRLAAYEVQLEKLGRALGLERDQWSSLQDNILTE